jgi:hypothetical protein
LWWSYEFKPTLADAAAIGANLMTLADAKMHDFALEGEIGSKAHYREVEKLHDSLIPGTRNNYVFETGARMTRTRNAQAQMFYAYQKPSTIEAFIHYWGLTGSAEAFWNMIPLSFLADYFYGVNDYLNLTRHDEHVKKLQYSGYCESIKIKNTLGYHVHTVPQSTINFILNGVVYPIKRDGHTLVSGFDDEYYVRRPTKELYGFLAPRFKRPTSGQWCNMAALARGFLK